AVMHIQPHVSFQSERRFSCMYPHAYAHYSPLGSGIRAEDPLGSGSRRNSIDGTGKGHEERISLSVDLVAVIGLEGRAQQAAALCQYTSVAITQLPEQARGPLDVGEEQCHRSRRQVRQSHCGSLSPPWDFFLTKIFFQ